jgi:hypothetical protein
MVQSLAELRAAEAEVAREWRWLHDALNEIARVLAEHGDAHAFRLMQAQAMAVGQRRVELSIRIAELERGSGMLSGDGVGRDEYWLRVYGRGDVLHDHRSG